jgi:hypothetical protein
MNCRKRVNLGDDLDRKAVSALSPNPFRTAADCTEDTARLAVEQSAPVAAKADAQTSATDSAGGLVVEVGAAGLLASLRWRSAPETGQYEE